MTANEIKEHILDNDFVEIILEELNCGHIKNKGNYISASNPDGGDNPQAIVVYLNENLTTIDYTRQLTKTNRTTDIFDLIAFFKDYTFPEALKFCCEVIGLNYYEEQQELPESLQILKMIEQMSIGEQIEEDKPLKPIPGEILSYYLPYGNTLFENDGISLITQRFFEVGFDTWSNSITIPIRDELGSLVGVKARRWEYNSDDNESKYFYLEHCSKSRILYGLYQNIKMIQEQGVVYVGESEKFVQQLYDIGYFGVSTGGSKISKTQIDMLVRLNVKIVFCYDKDIDEDQLKNIADMFLDGIPVYAMIDRDNILDEKESPSDSIKNWIHMVKNNVYKIKQ